MHSIKSAKHVKSPSAENSCADLVCVPASRKSKLSHGRHWSSLYLLLRLSPLHQLCISLRKCGLKMVLRESCCLISTRVVHSASAVGSTHIRPRGLGNNASSQLLGGPVCRKISQTPYFAGHFPCRCAQTCSHIRAYTVCFTCLSFPSPAAR